MTVCFSGGSGVFKITGSQIKYKTAIKVFQSSKSNGFCNRDVLTESTNHMGAWGLGKNSLVSIQAASLALQFRLLLSYLCGPNETRQNPWVHCGDAPPFYSLDFTFENVWEPNPAEDSRTRRRGTPICTPSILFKNQKIQPLKNPLTSCPQITG